MRKGIRVRPKDTPRAEEDNRLRKSRPTHHSPRDDEAVCSQFTWAVLGTLSHAAIHRLPCAPAPQLRGRRLTPRAFLPQRAPPWLVSRGVSASRLVGGSGNLGCGWSTAWLCRSTERRAANCFRSCVVGLGRALSFWIFLAELPRPHTWLVQDQRGPCLGATLRAPFRVIS
jgi:hypothetical protein